MNDGPELRTRRLLLRRWREEDKAPFAALNADPEVMEHFPDLLTRERSDALVERIERTFQERGFGWWALEAVDTGEFVGFTGLSPVPFEAHFTPAVEVGWRLARQAWGHGYATEAAREAVRFGFAEAGLTEIVSMTTATNLRSQAVMHRLGMARAPGDDFRNPRVDAEHPLSPCVLYRLRP